MDLFPVEIRCVSVVCRVGFSCYSYKANMSWFNLQTSTNCCSFLPLGFASYPRWDKFLFPLNQISSASEKRDTYKYMRCYVVVLWKLGNVKNVFFLLVETKVPFIGFMTLRDMRSRSAIFMFASDSEDSGELAEYKKCLLLRDLSTSRIHLFSWNMRAFCSIHSDLIWVDEMEM